MIYVKAYIPTLIVFLVLDFLWLGVAAKEFYATQLRDVVTVKLNLPAAAMFYAAYAAGIVFFAVMPALNSGAWQTALLNGAILGLLAYGTYDMTNLATVANWPLKMSIVDMIWGAVITSASAVAGVLTTRAFG